MDFFKNFIDKLRKVINRIREKLFSSKSDKTKVKKVSIKSESEAFLISDSELVIEVESKKSLISNSEVAIEIESKVPLSSSSEVSIEPELEHLIEGENESLIAHEALPKFDSEIEKKKVIRPKRALCPSFLKKNEKKGNISIQTKTVKTNKSTKPKIINLSEIPKKHIKIFPSKVLTQKERHLRKKYKRAKFGIKRRPKIVFNQSKGKILLRLPQLRFSGYETFDEFAPIYCYLTIQNNEDEIIKYEVEIKEEYCKIGKRHLKPFYIDIGLLKEYFCEIKTSGGEIIKEYDYIHPDISFFIFQEEEDYHPLMYNFNKFYKQNQRFWILLKNNLRLHPSSSGISEFIRYPNYILRNIGFNSENYDIQIIDEKDEILKILYLKPEITLESTKGGFIFDEFYEQVPLFSQSFFINLKCSEKLINNPKFIHIQNALVSEGFEQDEYFETIEWSKGSTFEIKPDVFKNKIGYYQIDLGFYSDYNEKTTLYNTTLRAYFRSCPIMIYGTNDIIIPSETGHCEKEISIDFYNKIILNVECEGHYINYEDIHDEGISWREIKGKIPPEIDQIELIFSTEEYNNRVLVKPYIPRLKWRLTNIDAFDNLIGTPIELNFDENFTMGKKINLEIQIIKKNIYEGLILKSDNGNISLEPIYKKKRFIYSFPLNTVYELIVKQIRNVGQMSMYISLMDQDIKILNITGEVGEFYEHKKPKRKRKIKVDRTKKIKYYTRNIITELKSKGYSNPQGRKVVATLLSLLTHQFKIDKYELIKMFFKDYKFGVIVNQFLYINNFIPRSDMTFGEYLDKLWPISLEKMEEIIEYLENKL